tara:strand:+ start:40 stop:1428 length:1389 start_codon:yes stop_codon:yes gene_type:complete
MFIRHLLLVALLCVPTYAQAAGPSTSLGSPTSLSAYSGVTQTGEGLPNTRPKFGIRAGDFVVQPRLFIESMYSSNFFREDDRNTDVELSEVMALHLRPGVAIYNPGFTNVAFSLAADADGHFPFGEEERVQAQQDLGGDVHGKINLFPKRALSMALNGRFKRELWTRPSSGTGSADRNDITAGANLAFHPGGRALEMKLGYSLNMTAYDDLESQNTDRHRVSFQTSWRFYPLSYLVLDANMNMVEYPDGDESEGEAANGYHVEGSPWKVLGGMNGYFSERLAFRIRGGYADTNLDAGEGYTGAVADVRMTYRFGIRSVWHLGYNLDAETAALGGFYSFHRGYTSFEQSLGKLGRLHFDFSVDARRFGAYIPANTTFEDGDGIEQTVVVRASDANREDLMLRAGLVMDFDFSRLFGLTLGYRYEASMSDYFTGSTPASTPGQEETFFAGYEDHRVLLTLNLRY